MDNFGSMFAGVVRACRKPVGVVLFTLELVSYGNIKGRLIFYFCRFGMMMAPIEIIAAGWVEE